MRTNAIKTILTLFLLNLSASIVAQRQYTPYDDLPGMIKSYKPVYSANFPEWGKMLYSYPVNYFEVIKAFNNSGKKDNKTLVRYYKLWKRHLSQWVKTDGTIFLPDLNKYYQRINNLQKAAFNSSKQPFDSSSNWTFYGPKETYWLNYQGSSSDPDACSWQANVYSFGVAPSNHDVIYCGTETGFVNKTTDKGETWQIMGKNYYFGGGITATAVHPTNPDIVYVAAGNQVHKSVDGGNNWVPILTSPNYFKADRLIIDPQNPDKIYAAANEGVYVTTDGGQTWVQKWNKQAYDVAIKPDNNLSVFAITNYYGKFRLVESTDGGNTFSLQSSFPDTIVNTSGGLLAISQANPDKLMAIMLSANNTPYLYKENLQTNIWSLVATGKTTQFPMNNGQGYFDLVFDISPANPNLLLIGTTTFYKSTNGGLNFVTLGGYSGIFTLHADFQDITILPDGDTWVSTDGGMYLSTDNFTSSMNIFSKDNGIVGSDMWGFDQGWNEDLVVGGRYHNGNMAISDFYDPKSIRIGGAESATGWLMKGKSRYAAFNDNGAGWILPKTAEGEPEGRFIYSKYPNMDEYGGRRSNMVFHPNYYGTIYVGEGTGFWKSTDMGETFDLVYDFGHRVRYMKNSYSNPDVFYADIIGMGLYRSSNGGVTWESKPALTSGNYGTSYWEGRTFFDISPVNENVIYACLQNGTWSGDIGKVFKSDDGGDTWEDFTDTLSEYTKDLIVQPDSVGNDIVYLFTNARYGQKAKVFVRKPGENHWENYDNNYPAGFYVNLAMPFYRDAKLRVSGTGGVWETSMADTGFMPLINPWVNSPVNNCMMDTLFFDDHSILNHQGASWHWDITPAPLYIENQNIRNPKVVLGNPGSYTVKLTVTKNGTVYEKEIPDMVTTTTCPSIDDCNNPAEVPKDMWRLIYVDSQETGYPGYATMSFDDDFSTIWHTRWSNGTDPYPHEIQIDMGQPYLISKFTYNTRQDGPNGRIKDYELYISEDSLNWGNPVSTGVWENTAASQSIEFDSAVIGQYFKLVALSEVNGGPWASAAEFSVVGCTDITGVHHCADKFKKLVAFPVPSSGIFSVSLPAGNIFNYSIYTVSGQLIQQGVINQQGGNYQFDLQNNNPGVYLLILQENGISYRIKIVKR